MSDTYVPTTGEVQRRYVDAKYRYSSGRRQLSVDEFKAWLAAHDAEVAAKVLEAATRERDAALAAVERVRAIAERSAVNPLIRIAEILAALDGAPEPEVSREAAVLVQVKRYLERFNPGGTHAQDAMAQALENILEGAQVAWAPSDDELLPVEGESSGE